MLPMFSYISKLLFSKDSNKDERVNVSFAGPVLVGWQSYDGSESREIKDLETLQKFDGLKCKDESTNEVEELSVYLQDGKDTAYFYEAGVRGGVLGYNYNEEKKQLWISIDFQSPRKLNRKELNDLKNFCEGQWYDGAGSGFSGEIADHNDGISPLGHPSKVYVTQAP